MRGILVLLAVLFGGCGPSTEAVTCCECLSSCDPFTIQANDAGSYEPANPDNFATTEQCAENIDDGLVVADKRCWDNSWAGQTSDGEARCAQECAAHYDQLALAWGRVL